VIIGSPIGAATGEWRDDPVDPVNVANAAFDSVLAQLRGARTVTCDNRKPFIG
jgi:hypothetical protein